VNVSVTEGNLSLIASGVTPGEVVVTDGQDKLQQGSRVEPHTQGTSGTRNASSANPDENQNQTSSNTQASGNEGEAQHARRSGPPTNTGNQNRGTASQ
jgi:multidrug efflux system membrane fusion protein